MWYFTFLLLSAVLVAHGKSVVKDDDDTPSLEWPDTYSFQAVRIYLEAGFSEDYQMWRTPQTSRVDYNYGAVKSIVDTRKYRFGYAYKITPQADTDGDSQDVCQKSRGMSFYRIHLEDILPDVDDFEEVGTEILGDVETTKFYSIDTSTADIEKRETLWATYNTNDKAWVPKRYEVENYNTWFGAKDKHEIWEFTNFKTEAINETFFDTKELCKDAITVSLKDDRVTKDLLFVDPDNEQHVDHVFNSFKKTYKRAYDVDGEEALRRNVFRRNMRLVSLTNRRNLGYKLVINKFSDRLPHEMKKFTGRLPRPAGQKGTIEFPYTAKQLKEAVETLPAEYDSRLYGLVGTVKNQEDCGSCWTFGTTVAMEGAVARSNLGNFITLSNQAILDCAWPYGGNGCDGGSDTAAFGWLMANGLPTVAEYGGYADKEGRCNIKNMTTLYTIKGFVDVAPNSVEALKVALVNHGPMSTSVNANDAFTQYAGGIFYDQTCDPSILNHEVGLVGYGEKDGETFWIIKNSWGPEWGIDGYMHISAKNNVCGTATEPSYVVL